MSRKAEKDERFELKARLDEQQKRQHEMLDRALRLLGDLLESSSDKGNHDT